MTVAGFEAQGLERDAELRRPTALGGVRGDPPHGIPVRVDVAAFVRHLRVGLGARGVSGEDETVAMIAERVEQHVEGVLAAGGEVLADVVDDNAGGRRVFAEDGDVEVVAVVGQAHFGLFTRGLTFERVGLDEAGGRRCQLPHGVVERAVDDHGRRRLHRRYLLAPIRRRDGCLSVCG